MTKKIRVSQAHPARCVWCYLEMNDDGIVVLYPDYDCPIAGTRLDEFGSPRQWDGYVFSSFQVAESALRVVYDKLAPANEDWALTSDHAWLDWPLVDEEDVQWAVEAASLPCNSVACTDGGIEAAYDDNDGVATISVHLSHLRRRRLDQLIVAGDKTPMEKSVLRSIPDVYLEVAIAVARYEEERK